MKCLRPCSSRWGSRWLGRPAHVRSPPHRACFLEDSMSPEARLQHVSTPVGQGPSPVSTDFVGFVWGMLQQHNTEACAVAQQSAQHSNIARLDGQATTPLLSQAATCVGCMASACCDLPSLLPAGFAGHLILLRSGALCQRCTTGGSQRWPPHAAPKHELSDDASTAHLRWHH